MGQYYMPIVIKGRKQKVHVYYSHKFNCGLKITEHSWFNNSMVMEIMFKLMNNPHHVVWLGDYSEVNKLDDKNNYRPIPHSRDNEPFKNLQWTSEFNGSDKKTIKEVICEMGGGFIRDTDEYMKYFNIAHSRRKECCEPATFSPDRMFEEYNEHRRFLNCNDYLTKAEIKEQQEAIKTMAPYIDGFYELLRIGTSQLVIVNHTKKQYIDLGEWWELCHFYDKYNGYDWCIHPLPLLTACGNGLGGGDYCGLNEKMCGYWAFDYIGVYHKNNTKKYEKFQDMKGFRFIEGTDEEE